MTPTTIDLALAGTENGVPIYAPPLDAITMQITYGIGWLLAHYPREFLHGLGIVGVVATCAYLAWDSTPHKKPTRRIDDVDIANSKSRR
jgi:hypothetical protein